jgi:hypothetical protein
MSALHDMHETNELCNRSFLPLLRFKVCTVGYQSKCRFRNRGEKKFKTAHFESLPRAQNLVFSHENFTKALSLSYLCVCQISRPKDPLQKSYSKSTNIGSIFPHHLLQLHMLVDC